AELRRTIDSSDPRIDLAEAAAAEATGDFVREHAAATRASTAAQRIGARLLVAHAELALAPASGFRGMPGAAIAHAQVAHQAFALAGDNDQEARALAIAAYSMAERGDVDEAERTDEKVLAMRRDMGDRKNAAKMLVNLALIATNRGQLERARNLA